MPRSSAREHRTPFRRQTDLSIDAALSEAPLLEVQADTLPYLTTRLVLPMLAIDRAPSP